MSPELVLIGEVEVYIRRFIAVEAEEGLEWYVVTVAVHFAAALRTVLRRKVKSRTVNAVREEFTVLALRTNVMRRQRIYLGDTRH